MDKATGTDTMAPDDKGGNPLSHTDRHEVPGPETADLDQILNMREDQGNHECEVWAEGAEGSYHWKTCTENPGHKHFIPAPQFTMDHLPWPYRDEDIFDCIGVIKALTVRLRVQCFSKGRPDNYIFSNYRGRFITHTGSGLVSEFLQSDIALIDDDDGNATDDDDESNNAVLSDGVTVNCPHDNRGENSNAEDSNTEDDESEDGEQNWSNLDGIESINQGVCPCPECAKSVEPRKEWYSLNIFTATHVVYDDLEGKNTVVDVFFDDEQSKDTMRKLYGVGLDGPDQREDGCMLTCITHEKDLYDILHGLSQRLAKLESRLFKKKVKKPLPPLCVIVSHPHGCAKKVSVGEWKERCIKGLKYDGVECSEYRYTTATCRGSSGAPVFLCGEGRGRDETLAYTVHFHSSGDINGTNKSGIWIEL